jgi:Carboxypeptidase regulatory-like domain
MEFKRMRGSALVLLILMTLYSWRADTQVTSGGVGSIEGMVADIQGARIPGAGVAATNESTHQQVETLTDSGGSYRFFGLSPGNYRVRFASRGFRVVMRTSVPVNASNAKRLDIRLEVIQGSSSEIKPFPESGIVAGVVIDPQGAAIAGARVTVTEDATGKKYKTVTDCDGLYSVANLALGLYSVQFAKKAFRTDAVKSVRVGALQAVTVNSKLQVGTSDLEPEIGGAMMPVEPDAPAAIQGRVTDPKGEPVPARIGTYDPFADKYYSTTTDSDGVYRMRGLPAGNYCFGYVTNPWGSGTGIVMVNPKQVATRDIQLPDLPERAEACTTSCVIETRVAKPAKPGIALHVYAESSVVFPSVPLWVTVTLTNTTSHSIVIRSHGEPHHDFEYNLYAYQYAYQDAYGRCACPTRLVANRAMNAELSRQGSTSSEVRIPPGGTLTDRVDLNRFMDWGSLIAFGPKFEIWVSRLDMSNEKHGMERKDLPTVRSNLIKLALIIP